jgi:hypothetical protein
MVKIEIIIKCKESTQSWSRTDKKTGQEHTHTTKQKFFNKEDIEINVESCGYFCNCNDKKNESDDNTLDQIKEIMKDDDEDNVSYNIGKIKELIENDKCVKIYKKICKIDNDDVLFGKINKIINGDNEDDNEDDVVTKFPFAVRFTEIDGGYIANIHTANNNAENLYITIAEETDAFCCSRGSYEYSVPKQLSLTSPSKIGNYFDEYENCWHYKKQWDNTYKSSWY